MQFMCVHVRVTGPCREVGEYRVIGCPKCIDDNKYERNAFIFNFVFVFSSSINTSAYEPVIQKMGNAFRTYEVFHGQDDF